MSMTSIEPIYIEPKVENNDRKGKNCKKERKNKVPSLTTLTAVACVRISN